MYSEEEKRILMDKKNARLHNLVMYGMRNTGDKILEKIFYEYGTNIFRRCSAPANHSEKIFADTMKGLDTAVEIGTLNGITAAVMTQFVKHVHTFDIIDYENKWKLWEFLNVKDKITFHLIENELDKYDILDKLTFDIAYIDGDHLHHTWSDFLATRKCGKIIIHETDYEIGEPIKLANALKKYGKVVFNQDNSIAYWEKR